MKDKIFIALDVPTVKEASQLVEKLGTSAECYKIGYQLLFGGGLELARDLKQAGKTVFLDMKLHDIGNTIEKAVENVARLGLDFLTIHAYPQTIKAAAAGSAGSPLKILAVTIMTSYDNEDVKELGFHMNVQELFQLRAAQAKKYGAHGLILSPEELLLVKDRSLLLVTPGIRPRGAETGDQKRIMTPEDAFQAGADYLVIGRPVTAASNPKLAIDKILATVEGR
jgi:orotidine-5'-phosphate decarboxylase